MEAYFPAKMKRKDLEEVNDDFSDFSLSSPARKIRRLDAELPPIIEEEEPVNPVVFGHPPPAEETFVEQEMKGSPIEISGLPENEERAIVLFDPVNNMPLLQSRSPFSISVNSDLLSGFKNPVIWSNRSNLLKPLQHETHHQENTSGPINGCLAVVPWVPKQSHHGPIQEPEAREAEIPEMMDADYTEATTMDIEDNDINDDKFLQRVHRNEMGPMSVSDGSSQWQQHCMVPQPPHNLSTPITWSG